MRRAWSSRGWSSPDHPKTQATELLAPAPGGESLASALRRVDLGSSPFLIVRVHGIESGTVTEAVAAFVDSFTTARLCLAGDREALARLSETSNNADCVVLMLDDVDERTPLGDIAWDRVEAVRFSSDFVARAARSMRVGLVLDSMLWLAGELGLCTFGAKEMSGSPGATGRFKFDYSPIATATPIAISVRRASEGSATRILTPR